VIIWSPHFSVKDALKIGYLRCASHEVRLQQPYPWRLGFVFPTGNLRRKIFFFLQYYILVSNFATKENKACALRSIDPSISSEHERDKKPEPCSPQLLHPNLSILSQCSQSKRVFLPRKRALATGPASPLPFSVSPDPSLNPGKASRRMLNSDVLNQPVPSRQIADMHGRSDPFNTRNFP